MKALIENIWFKDVSGNRLITTPTHLLAKVLKIVDILPTKVEVMV